MVVEHCGEEIICRTDGVEVTGKVEVDVLHGHYLSVAAACRAALDAEYGTEGGLTQSHRAPLAYSRKTVCKTDGGRGLSLTRRRGSDGCDENELSVTPFGVLQKAIIYLRLVFSVVLDIFLGDIELCRYLVYMLHFALLCDLYIG